MQTYFRLSLVSAENNVCEPEPGNDFCDVGILSQSQFSSSSPRTTARSIRCEEHSSFILSWNLIGQRETKVITSQKPFPGSGSQTLFSAETSDSRKYVCVCRLVENVTNWKFQFRHICWLGRRVVIVRWQWHKLAWFGIAFCDQALTCRGRSKVARDESASEASWWGACHAASPGDSLFVRWQLRSCH